MIRKYDTLRIFTSSCPFSFTLLLGPAFLVLLSLGPIETSRSSPLLSSVTAKGGVAIGNNRYRQLYDVIFPRGIRSAKGLVLFRLTLRYTTRRGPDIQYEITKFEDGRVLVVSMECRRGALFYLKLDDPLETISEAKFTRVKEAAKTIPIAKKEFDLPPERSQELAESFNGLAFPKLAESNSVYFDGTAYDLWVQTDREEISYSVGAEPLGSQKISLPIVKWMNLAHRVLSQEIATTRTAKDP